MVVHIVFRVARAADEWRAACTTFQLVGGVLERLHVRNHPRCYQAVRIDVPLPAAGVLAELVSAGGLDVVDHVPAQFVDVAVQFHVAVACGQDGLHQHLADAVSEVLGLFYTPLTVETEMPSGLHAVVALLKGHLHDVRICKTAYLVGFALRGHLVRAAVNVAVDDGIEGRATVCRLAVEGHAVDGVDKALLQLKLYLFLGALVLARLRVEVEGALHLFLHMQQGFKLVQQRGVDAVLRQLHSVWSLRWLSVRVVCTAR